MNKELLTKKEDRELKILTLHEGAKGTPVEPVLRELIELFEKEIYLYTMYGLNEFKEAVEKKEKGDELLSIVIDEEGQTVRQVILELINS